MPNAPIRKVLVAHNFYRVAARSGEDAVYGTEGAMLERAGLEVVRFEKHSEAIYQEGVTAKIRAASDASYSKSVYRELTQLLQTTRPDLAHFHAHFPLLSPSAFQACIDSGIPVVVTLHNFRLNCAAGTLFRDSMICEKCWGASPWPAVRHRCYQHSFLASAAAVRAQFAYRELITRGVWINQYVALTEFARGKHIEIGVPKERITVKGNTVANPPRMGAGTGDYALYVGRLGPEKGVRTILEAWELLGSAAPKLKMAGEGPLAQEILSKTAASNLNIELLGPLPRPSVMELMKNARMLVFASRWYEGFPLVIVESLACGTPVLGSRIGGIPELIIEGVTGTLVPPADAKALAQGVLRLSQLLAAHGDMRASCRNEFDRRHSPDQNLRELLGIYNTVLARSR
jgi:glycosyltransferase involved in cell wall biosynthesis